jgi:hypothetical protein
MYHAHERGVKVKSFGGEFQFKVYAIVIQFKVCVIQFNHE